MKKLCACLAVLFAVAFPLRAEDKKEAPKLSGAWTREADSLVIVVNFKTKDTLQTVITAGENTLTADSKYTVAKDGTAKAVISEVTIKGDFPAQVVKGLKYSFKFAVDGKAAKLTDFEVADMEGAKELMEGDYKAK